MEDQNRTHFSSRMCKGGQLTAGDPARKYIVGSRFSDHDRSLASIF